jgi:1-phosphatidylinositol phosphodiesterase
MASLSIRNLSVTPLELKLIERFEGQAVPGPNALANITSTITGMFNATHTPSGGVVPKGGDPHERQDISGVVVEPFTTRGTDIRAADPTREVLRLTFEQPGTGHRYVVDAPGPSPRSLVMTRVGDAPHEFTAVYVAGGSTLAIFSSANLSSWMRELQDGYALSTLSIPGTHNSPTCHVALPSVRCQAVGVREQLNNGVRFMDIRVSANPDNDELTLVHSAFPISLTGSKHFGDLLADVYAFLDANPSEALLMSIKREGTGKGSDQQLSRYLASGRYLGGDNERRWFTEPRIPNLGEARGKVVLIRRFNIDDGLRAEKHGGAGWGIDSAAWPDNCEDSPTGTGQIRVQDFYEVDQSTNIEKKINFARAHLERAAERLFAHPGTPDPPQPFFVNFLSASNFFNASCWPEKIAAKVNPAVVEYLCIRHGDAHKGPGQLGVGDAGTGIVVTDWVGNNGDWDLIRCIVGWNARLQLKQ